ncbi:MAG: Rossmann-like domain-containing protein [Pollutimonas bauzanensis]
MTIPSDTPSLLADLHQHICARLGPAIEDLFLERVVVGIFFTGVKLNNGHGGMSATPIKSVPYAVCCPSSAMALPSSGKLRGKPVTQALEDLYRPQDMRRALAIATLNALAETLWLRDGPPQDAVLSHGDAFQQIPMHPGDRVVLVGAFPPFMRELRKRGVEFKVLELDPATLKPDEMPYYAPADSAAAVIPWANILISTGTTLINGSVDDLLALVAPGAQVALIGPTATLAAQPYARHGVTLIGGTRVRQPDPLLDLLAEGGSGYHFFEKTVERVTLHLPQAPLEASQFQFGIRLHER